MKIHQLIKLLSNCAPNDDVIIACGNAATGQDELEPCDYFEQGHSQVILAASLQCAETEANIESLLV